MGERRLHRRLQILREVLTKGSVTQTELVQKFALESNIIHGDLEALARDPRIILTYRDELGSGRATTVAATPALIRPGTGLQSRFRRNTEGKLLVAREALRQILATGEDKASIWIGAGGTNFLLAIELAKSGRIDREVGTNAVYLGSVLNKVTRLTLLGGRLDKAEMTLIENADIARHCSPPWFTFLGTEEWNFDDGCACGRNDTAFQKVACELTKGRLFILTDADELGPLARQPFASFKELEKDGKDYLVICHVPKSPVARRQRVEEEARKFPPGKFLMV